VLNHVDSVTDAIRHLNKRLAVLSLPEETDQTLLLVAQQQQLLEAYVHATIPAEIDTHLIRDVLSQTDQLMGEARRAHADTSVKLDALALGRSAVSAYEGALEK